jgi:hypothetical protein
LAGLVDSNFATTSATALEPKTFDDNFTMGVLPINDKMFSAMAGFAEGIDDRVLVATVDVVAIHSARQ